MLITRESDYAVRCVWYLVKEQNRVILVNEIAEKMSIPRNFLAKILQKLKKANIVRSYMGIGGGFQLVQEAENISIYDVVKAIDGSVVVKNCNTNRGSCKKAPYEPHPGRPRG